MERVILLADSPDRITVEQGKFRLSSVDIIGQGDGFLILEADCHSKYPWVGAMLSDGPPEVLIWEEPAGEGEPTRSLHLDETTEKITRIVLPDYTAGWQVMTDGGRYTIRIVAFRYDYRTTRETRKELWRDETSS
jgi:hypothetical protein